MGLGGIVTLDMGLTLWTTATFFAFLAAEQARERPATQRRWMLAAWAAMALAVLSKGLVGIIFAGAAIFLAMLLARDWRVIDRIRLLPGLAVFFAIAAPWFVAVSMANDEFAQFFFFHEHFARFLTTTHRRVEPWWYFPADRGAGLPAVDVRAARGGHPCVARGKGRPRSSRFASRSCGARSWCSSSARRDRSCRPMSCRCFPPWRWSSAAT
jgi:4-amino-4-deoxy-L-arabinose transferase-like glycosyltransferase